MRKAAVDRQRGTEGVRRAWRPGTIKQAFAQAFARAALTVTGQQYPNHARACSSVCCGRACSSRQLLSKTGTIARCAKPTVGVGLGLAWSTSAERPRAAADHSRVALVDAGQPDRRPCVGAARALKKGPSAAATSRHQRRCFPPQLRGVVVLPTCTGSRRSAFVWRVAAKHTHKESPCAASRSHASEMRPTLSIRRCRITNARRLRAAGDLYLRMREYGWALSAPRSSP